MNLMQLFCDMREGTATLYTDYENITQQESNGIKIYEVYPYADCTDDERQYLEALGDVYDNSALYLLSRLDMDADLFASGEITAGELVKQVIKGLRFMLEE